MSFENVEDVYVLSPMQQGILFHTLYAPHAGTYIIQSGWALQGALNLPLFLQSWQEVVDHHPILRTSFVWEDLETPLQIVHQRVTLPHEHHDWRGLSADEQNMRWESFLEQDRTRSFSLNRAPLLRLALFRLAEDSYRFIWSYHHLLLDGWSHPQVLQEVFTVYAALCRGQRPSLERSRPYRDYIAWLQEQDVSQAETFWRKTLKGFPAPTRLAVDQTSGTRTELQGKHFADQELHFSKETLASLEAFARSHQLTLNTLVQGAWALLLRRYSREIDLVYGTVVSGRPVMLAGIESMIGLFINSLPVRVQMPDEAILLPWLKELQQQQAELRQYEYSPLVQVQGWSDVSSGLPLFETILAFENYPVVAPLPEQHLDLSLVPLTAFNRTHYPLELVVIPRPTLIARLSYDREHFDPGTISRMLGHFQHLLESMPTHAAKPLWALPMLSVAEQQQLLVEWNDTQTTQLPPRCVHHLFEEQAERTPDALALIDDQHRLTYRELNERANQLAHHLQSLGVGPEVLVGICLERSAGLLVSLLAILKAGGAYVPVDPAYPPERLAFLLADARVALLLTQPNLVSQFPQGNVPIVVLETLQEILAQQPNINPISLVSGQNLAYVMYTSGSTGQPKGIAITHRNIVRLVYRPTYVQISPSDVFLQFASVAFDAATFEIWACLANGACLVLAPPTLPDLEEVTRLLSRYHITILWLTASLFHQLVELHPEGLRPVKQLLAGGETLSVPHIRQAITQLPGCRLINGYGPTENTTFSCCYQIPSTDPLSPSVPIGYPIGNTQVYVLDEQFQPVPVGVVGELYLGGEGLARGYLHRPDLTAERFLPHPWSSQPGARLYRTGDLARYRPDGTLELIGRNDQQVKLRGFRIELGEIEATLRQHAQVHDAVVLMREDAPGEKQLVAYVVVAQTERARTPKDALRQEVRQFVQKRLPDYMVPAIFLLLDVLPLTPNGKVDRRALPPPDRDRYKSPITYMAPRTPIEEKLERLWADLLRLERVGITDNFFELGGHSLLALRLIGQVQAMFQIDMPLRTLFENPTIEGLALAVVQKQLEQREDSEVARLLEQIEHFTEAADPEDRS